MGYLRKNSTVCNPAKKNLTVFQNSATRSVTIYGTVAVDFGTHTAGYYGKYEACYNRSSITIRVYDNRGTAHDIPPNRSRSTRVGESYRREIYNAANGQRVYNGSNVPVGSRTETYWNTKWSKLSA